MTLSATRQAPVVPPSVPSPSPTPSQPASATQTKQEPSIDSRGIVNLPQNNTYNSDPRFAQQRAEQLVKQQFGTQTMNSIGQVQPGGPQKSSVQYLAPGQAQQNQQPRVKQEQSSPVDVKAAQHDGAGDAKESWRAVIEKKNATGEYEPMGRINADRIVRRHAQAIQQRLEAGGLLVPLEEQYPPNKRARTGKEPALAKAGPSVDPASTSAAEPSAPRNIPGLDGDVEDEDIKFEDLGGEDAINSDLDDSEDELNENIEGDSFEGDQILCLYDKVQRVKNKWKCTLKDGIVTVNGKDYVFHKANGEFEW